MLAAIRQLSGLSLAVYFMGTQAADSASSSFERAGCIGVSLAGAEFGVNDRFSNDQPGTLGRDYTFNSASSVRYFHQRGIRLIRFPFRWERVQPRLGGPLGRKYLSELRAFCRLAHSTGVHVVLDLHNYGRYRCHVNGDLREYIIDEQVDGAVPVSREHFADVWRRLAVAFRDEPGVIGYGLMNEPHDMGGSDWQVISQRAVDSIRTKDARTTIVVAGDDWSSAERFWEANGDTAWIRDSSQNTIYEAHCYFDADGSGNYKLSFAEELDSDASLLDRGTRRVKPFLDWCQVNRVRGFVGEFGTPPDPEWREVTRRFLEQCARHRVTVCYWAAGEWWRDCPLSIQPSKDYRVDAPQFTWLRNFQQRMNDRK